MMTDADVTEAMALQRSNGDLGPRPGGDPND